MTDAERLDGIFALLRACVLMPPEKCRNTLIEGLRQADIATAKKLAAGMK